VQVEQKEQGVKWPEATRELSTVSPSIGRGVPQRYFWRGAQTPCQRNFFELSSKNCRVFFSHFYCKSYLWSETNWGSI